MYLRTQAAVERAKQLREERKNGQVDDSATFTPQVNRRPSYLDNRPDTLDVLSSNIAARNPNYNPNDVMEQPLPGAKGYSIAKAPSPGSDALGKEMRRFPTGDSSSSNSNINSNSNSSSSYQGGQYRSKFMQQYDVESSIPSTGGYPPVAAMSDKDPDETFLSTLRGGGGGGGSNSKGRKAGPGWNDDTTSSSGLFGEPPARSTIATSRQATTSSHNNNNNRTNVKIVHPDPPRRVSNAVNSNIPYAAEPSIGSNTSIVDFNKKVSPVKLKANRPQFDTGSAAGGATGGGGGSGSYLQQHQQQQQQQQQYRQYNNDSSDYNDDYSVAPPKIIPSDDVVVNQARSRLSLLKSKMRKSESSSSSRGSSYSNSSSSNNILRSTSVQYQDVSVPKSAPYQQQQYTHTKTPPKAPNNTSSSSSNNQRSRIDYDAISNNYSKPTTPNYRQQQQQQQVLSPQQQQQQLLEEEIPIEAGEQIECPDCGRKFNSGPYQKHIKICAKVFLQKRKQFDSKKMRIQDNPELVKILNQKNKTAPGGVRGSRANPKAASAAVSHNEQAVAGGGGGKKADWKQQSEAFREAMKAARQVSKAIATGAPLPPPVASAPDPSLMPCPHCGRRFNARAGERHIPQCQNIIAKPTRLNRGTGGGGGVNGTSTAKPGGGKGRF